MRHSSLLLAIAAAVTVTVPVRGDELTTICAGRPAGLYCHPVNAAVQVWCDGGSSTTSSSGIVTCPLRHVCRSHRQLGTEEEQQQRLHHAQCVSMDELDLDAFCEDKINEHRRTATTLDPTVESGRLHQLMTRHFTNRTASSTGTAGPKNVLAPGDELLTVTQQCNPFQAERKQLLHCAVVRRACKQKVEQPLVSTGNDSQQLTLSCVPTLEIAVFIDDCPTYDVCRQFETDQGNQFKEAKCVNPVYAMCLDRFWSIYAEKYTVADVAASTLLKFEFCDPFLARKKLHCEMELRLRAVQVAAPETDEVKLRVQRDFPALAVKLYNDVTEDNTIPAVSLSVQNIRIRSSWCPDAVPPAPNTDPAMIRAGPVCKQLSRTLSRCMTRPFIDVPAKAVREFLKGGFGGAGNGDTEEVDNDSDIDDHGSDDSVGGQQQQPVLIPASYLGFCFTYSTPGQYCVPGSPEIGVACPQGRVIHCRRPPSADPASWSDVGKSQRCVQHFGKVPVPGDPLHQPADPFRQSPVLDHFGVSVGSAWFATCTVL